MAGTSSALACVVQRANGDSARAERLAFESLLAELATRLAKASPEAVIAEIESALGRLVIFLGFDRCSYGEFSADGTLSILCSAAADGADPARHGEFAKSMPWFRGEMLAGRIVALSRIPQDLPPQATGEVEYCRSIGLRSNLSIPLFSSGRVIGAIAFSAFRTMHIWPPEVVTRLTIVGELFVSAVARARMAEEAQRLRDRLWHADRVARAGVLTAAIAHELNQPLAAILSNAQAGLSRLDHGTMTAQEMRSILEAVVRDDKRAAETIRSMRALLRRDEGGRTRIDLAATLREILQWLAAELHRQGVRVETALDEACWVVADKVQLEQVALNLVLNAAAAMRECPRDERLLRVSAGRTGDGRVEAAVCDAGVGIAAEHRDAVFEPFWTTRREGLGLGLAICRSIVQAHGGHIRVDSNKGRGATFRFELPAEARAEAGVDTPSTAEPTPAETAACDAMVAVVDDDPTVRDGVVRLLRAEGWCARAYPSATAYVEQAVVARTACIVLDQRMPGMSGLELLKSLRAMGAVPAVILLSGHDDLATGVEAMKLGAMDVLAKPVDREPLVAAVRRALDRHAREQQRRHERDACSARLERLSAREREVLAQVIRGRLNKQIAADLDITETTVKQHRGRVMEKTEARSVPELIRVCEAAGFAVAPGTAPAAATRG